MLSRFRMLVRRYENADKFFASDVAKEEKLKWLPELEKVIEELAPLYTQLLAEGKVSSDDLPISYSATKAMFGGIEVGGEKDEP